MFKSVAFHCSPANSCQRGNEYLNGERADFVLQKIELSSSSAARHLSGRLIYNKKSQYILVQKTSNVRIVLTLRHVCVTTAAEEKQ